MDGSSAAGPPRQIRRMIIMLAAMLALLVPAYYLFVRTDYAVLYTDLRTADASAVVAELDRQGVSYQLRDGGATILVPAEEAAGARLAVAGSDVPMRGSVGFELFNQSDMGLTDFAQKVNYQRALQGELARTIMMMDGVENARVHLALPERSLFRGNRADPRAAVTVVGRRGRTIDGARVAGIQRLVAAAVPDLALDHVVVLDELGRVISGGDASETLLPPDLAEQEAVRQYFGARARAAAANVLPGLRFDVRVVLTPLQLALGEEASYAGHAESAPGGSGSARDFRLRIVLLTPAPLNPADEAVVRNAVAAAVELNEGNGDGIAFSVAPAPAHAATASAEQALRPLEAQTVSIPPAPQGWPGSWSLAIALFAGIGAAALLLRARQSTLNPTEREALAARIRKLLAEEAAGHGR